MPTFSEVADGLQMPLAEAMSTQRAIRRLLPDPVDDDTVLELLRLAVKAPSGSNAQSWEFVVVRDPDVKHQLARLNRQALSLSRRMHDRKTGDDCHSRILDAVQWQADHFEDVPVIVVACLRAPAPLPGHRRRRLVRVDLPGRPEPPAGRPVDRPGRRTDHAAALVRHPRPPDPGAPARVTRSPSSRWAGRGVDTGPPPGAPVEAVIHLDRYGNRPFASVTRATMEGADMGAREGLPRPRSESGDRDPSPVEGFDAHGNAQSRARGGR